MDIRAFKPSDVEPVKKLFDKFYNVNKQEDFPDLTKDKLCSFIVENSNHNIITAGCIRSIAEICLITDKDKSVRQRVYALYEVLHATKHIAREFGFDWLHAITDDPIWASQMKDNGFVSRGEDLQIHVGDIR
jgi:hypothetical protein